MRRQAIDPPPLQGDLPRVPVQVLNCASQERWVAQQRPLLNHPSVHLRQRMGELTKKLRPAAPAGAVLEPGCGIERAAIPRIVEIGRVREMHTVFPECVGQVFAR